MQSLNDRLTFGKPTPVSDERLRELMLYIAAQSENDPGFGATKLNKLLYFADFFHFMEHGKSITGAQYMRLENGPAPRKLKPIREKLVRDKRAAVRNAARGPWEQQRLVTLDEPDVDLFEPSELGYVNAIIRQFWGASAKVMSRMSHGRPWLIAQDDKAPIPYEAGFISDDVPTDEDAALFRRLAREREWGTA